MQAHDVGLSRCGRVGPKLAVIAGGLGAALVTAATMVAMLLTLQVRTLPERLLELMLLVIPPDVFETGLQRFGFDAKRYAFAATAVSMLVVLTALGAIALARRWPVRGVLMLSLALWLFVMVVVMPLTDAGPFAIALINGTKAAVGAHLTMALAYAASLVTFGHFIGGERAAPARRVPGATPVGPEPIGPRHNAWSRPASRRSALVLSVGAVAAYVGTLAAVRWGPRTQITRVVVLDPEPPDAKTLAPTRAPEPTPTIAKAPDLATRSATPVVQAMATRPPIATPPAVAAPATPPPTQAPATPTAGPAGDFEPPPPRRLARDQDGVVLPSGRRAGELTARITANDDFYVVSKNAAGDPFIALRDWRLRVDGEVKRPVELDHRSLRNLPPVEVTKTLQCISNFVTKCELAPFGCDLISTAVWKGARLSDIVALAGGLKPGVTSLAAVATDDFTTALPIEVALDPETLLVYEMNGQPLPREHGFPARVLVPGRYGMKNAKWVIALRPLGREFDDWYGQRNWSRHAIVKTMTRIDAPGRDAELPPGHHRIAGIAYAGSRGIQQVEISADGGEHWRVAEIIDRPNGQDVWVRWESSFTLAPGTTLTLMARATDGDGELQMEAFSLPQPDGSTGWHSLDVRAQDAG
jgi:DMSO/TMAO reductase YedYZ molybdopterin-dependent catalytic subunit